MSEKASEYCFGEFQYCYETNDRNVSAIKKQVERADGTEAGMEKTHF